MVSINPVSYTSQVVAGTNYRVKCVRRGGAPPPRDVGKLRDGSARTSISLLPASHSSRRAVVGIREKDGPGMDISVVISAFAALPHTGQPLEIKSVETVAS